MQYRADFTNKKTGKVGSLPVGEIFVARDY